jgi:ubiquinone biosynthesis monooxygenase Coq7
MAGSTDALGPADRPRRLPGDPAPDVGAMIRVDQAGEYGAGRIYAGQIAVMGGRAPLAGEIRRMAEQEARHLASFDSLLVERRVRPTILQPIWNVGGYALGVVTALMGPRSAMACTAAVEAVIDEHYSAQAEALAGSDAQLRTLIEESQADEQEHRRTALEADAEKAPGYPMLEAVIGACCRTAIALSKRV